MGKTKFQALAWWNYLEDDEKDAVIEMAYNLREEEREELGLRVVEEKLIYEYCTR